MSSSSCSSVNSNFIPSPHIHLVTTQSMDAESDQFIQSASYHGINTFSKCFLSHVVKDQQQLFLASYDIFLLNKFVRRLDGTLTTLSNNRTLEIVEMLRPELLPKLVVQVIS